MTMTEAVRRGWPTDEQEQDTGDTESRVRLHRVNRPDVAKSGLRFQRCGGGVRVVRRQKHGRGE